MTSKPELGLSEFFGYMAHADSGDLAGKQASRFDNQPMPEKSSLLNKEKADIKLRGILKMSKAAEPESLDGEEDESWDKFLWGPGVVNHFSSLKYRPPTPPRSSYQVPVHVSHEETGDSSGQDVSRPGNQAMPNSSSPPENAKTAIKPRGILKKSKVAEPAADVGEEQAWDKFWQPAVLYRVYHHTTVYRPPTPPKRKTSDSETPASSQANSAEVIGSGFGDSGQGLSHGRLVEEIEGLSPCPKVDGSDGDGTVPNGIGHTAEETSEVSSTAQLV